MPINFDMLAKTCDFAGYATRYNTKCDDGRTILPGAFSKQHGMKLPLVWRHFHDEIGNVLGHSFLEDRPDGMYSYNFFNKSKEAQEAKLRVDSKDLDALSIYANKLVEKSSVVTHGVLRELSLVLSGANPGAKIDFVAIQHGDSDDWVASEEEAIIYSGEEIVFRKDIKHESKDTDESGKTFGDVFSTLNEEQQDMVYGLIAMVLDEEDDELEQSGDSSEEDNETFDEGDISKMKKNVFEGKGRDPKQTTLIHDTMRSVLDTAKKGKVSLKAAYLAHMDSLSEDDRALIHAGTYGIGSDRTNLELLFPDAAPVHGGEPQFISRQMAWVKKVISAVHKSPFSRIKSVLADITADEARAKGYITGNLKVEEVFPILKRVTTPTTIYKKQKLDRDDIIDITDFNVVVWLKKEMRMMLDEELAVHTLISDGRAVDDDDRINPTSIRPIYGDSVVYVHYEQVDSDETILDLIDSVVEMRTNYQGSGSPSLYCAPSFLTAMLLVRDGENRRMYRTVAELAAELMVSEIVEVPQMEGVSRTVEGDDFDLRAIVVNLSDYTYGADKGGETAFFDDFDIDYNQYKYLFEARLSGALTMPKSALVLEQAVPAGP